MRKRGLCAWCRLIVVFTRATDILLSSLGLLFIATEACGGW